MGALNMVDVVVRGPPCPPGRAPVDLFAGAGGMAHGLAWYGHGGDDDLPLAFARGDQRARNMDSLGRTIPAVATIGVEVAQPVLGYLAAGRGHGHLLQIDAYMGDGAIWWRIRDMGDVAHGPDNIANGDGLMRARNVRHVVLADGGLVVADLRPVKLNLDEHGVWADGKNAMLRRRAEKLGIGLHSPALRE